MKVRVRISKSESGGYIASCPSLPGCVTRGSTKDQARENMNDAIKGYLASLVDFVPERITDELILEV